MLDGVRHVKIGPAGDALGGACADLPARGTVKGTGYGQDSQREHDGCGGADGGEEHLAASVAAGSDPAPVLDAGEQVLDAVALPAERAVMASRVPAPALGRYAGRDPLVSKGFAEPAGVMALVGQKHPGGRQIARQAKAPLSIAHLPCRQEERQRTPAPVADRVQPRVQPAFGAPDGAGAGPPFERLAALRCASRWVLSIIIVSPSAPGCAGSVKIRANTPMRDQRTNLLQRVLGGP